MSSAGKGPLEEVKTRSGFESEFSRQTKGEQEEAILSRGSRLCKGTEAGDSTVGAVQGVGAG